MEKDPFIYWYKNNFEKLNEVPPEEVWENIAESTAFTERYKQHFNNFNEVPPEEVWNSISETLNINEAWKGIDKQLEVNRRRKLMIRRGSYAALLLLISFGLAYMLADDLKEYSGDKGLAYNGSGTRKISSAPAGNFNLTKQRTIVGSTEKKLPENGKTFSLNPSAVKNKHKEETLRSSDNGLNAAEKNNITSADNLTETVSTGFTASKITVKRSKVIKISSPTTPVINITEKEISVLPIREVVISNETTPLALRDSALLNIEINEVSPPAAGTFLKGIYAGGVYSISNIWLLNNQTFSGFSSNSLDQTDINAGNSYGISAGYGFAYKWAAELNWYVNSNQGQTYHIYDEGRYQVKNIKLDYNVINFSLRQRITSYTKNRRMVQSHGFVAGINFGYLKSAKEICGEQTEITKDNYHSSDFGLRFGYGYELLAFKHLLFSGSLQSNIGLKNIYSGNDLVPGNFNRTHTAGIGAEIGIKYLLR